MPSNVKSPYNIRKNGRFIKRKRLDREKYAAAARAAKAAAQRHRQISETLESSARDVEDEEETLLQTFLDQVMDGRRIFDSKMLWKGMWCYTCKRGLCVRDIVKEMVRGLAYVWRFKCPTCLVETEVSSSSTYYALKTCRQRYTVNSKLIFGMTDSGMGPDQINTVLSALNIPCLDAGTLSRYREEVGQVVIGVANESCQEALLLEKELTQASPLRNLGTQPLSMDSDDESTNLDAEDDSNTFKTPVLPSNAAPTAHGDARFDSNDEDDPDELQTPAQPSTPRGTANATSTDHATPPPNVPPEDSPFTTTPRRRTRIGVSIDMQFSTRFNGKKYDSLAGQSTMIGLKSKKICGWESLTRKCWKCERGRPHLCKGVFKGSAKAMEPEAAVRLICKNSSLNEANVVVAAVAGDDDAASASAIRHNSTTHIVKWSDHNHTVKSVKNGLFVIQARFPKIFPKSYINYFLSCYSTAVKQNKGNPKGLRRNLKALVPHAFGDHGTCGAWCGFIKNPATYKHKYFEDNGKDLAACEPLRRDLEAHFRRYIIRAATIAPAASSQKNEAVNNVFISKSAKRTFTGGTWRHTYAIASGVAQTNIGTSYQKNVYSALALSPSKGGDKYREKKDVWRKRVAHIKSQQAAKIRRKYLAQHRSRVKVHVEGGEGISYEPGMGFNRPVDESVRSGGVVEPVVQRPVPDHNDIKLIYFDVETDGHGNIIEMGAKCDDGDHATFQKYAYPPKDITEHVTRVTSLSIIEGELCYKGNAVTCSSLFAVINSFFVFLRKFEKPIVLIAHHAHSDAYALIKGCADFYLLPSLAQLVIGFVDTLPLFKKNPVILAEALAEQSLENKMKLSFSQSTLASKYVPNFRLEDAHGALYDSEILLQLCTALDVTRQDLLSNITLLSHFVDRQVELRNKKIFSPGLAVMVGPGISKMTTEKIAEKGFTVGALAQKLLDDGQERFAQWFKDLNNRKTALVAVIDYLCAWLDLNKDDVNVMDL